MKPLHVRVVLFDPASQGGKPDFGYPITSGILVDIARFEPYHPEHADARLPLTPDPDTGLFLARDPDAEPDERWFFRVKFLKVNFDTSAGALRSMGELPPGAANVLVPSRIPYWDSGWDDGYRTNEFFGNGRIIDSSPEKPLVLRVPLRRVYAIGHRGAPYELPENTIASFRRALDMGASGLECDLCWTKDGRVAVFHDPEPDRARQVFEDFPFELVSPEVRGRIGLIRRLRKGRYVIARRKFLFPKNVLHLVRLTVDRLREYYRYRHVDGIEHSIPDLEELLEFAVSESGRLHLLFFDIKNPDWDEIEDRDKYLAYGRAIAEQLRRYPRLPETLIVANQTEQVVGYLRESFSSVGERRCLFACDSVGGLGAWLGFARNPLDAARALGTQVVSIGSRFRSGDLEEITEATRDRDYATASDLRLVLHWTLNDETRMRASLAAGVNGIVTDRLDILTGELRSLGISPWTTGDRGE